MSWVSLVVLATWALMATPGRAAVVGPEGYSTGFDVRPAAADWATKYVQGAQGDVYDLTNAVQALSATNINVQLVDGGTADPATARANGFWTAGGGAYVATRPAANRCTLLMATLLNNSGTNALSALVRYDLGIKVPSSEPDYPGLRAFYSLTGLSNSWVPIPEFSSPTPVAATLTAEVRFSTVWPDGANLYLLWADDNANNPSGSVQDPAYTVDNFFAMVTGGRPAGQPLGVNLTAPTNNAWFFGAEQLRLDTDAIQDGTVVKVEFFVDGSKLGEVTESPYRLDWDHPPLGPHVLLARITDQYGASEVSSAVSVFLYDASGSPFVQITSPTNGTVFGALTNVGVSALATAWDGVTNVEFLTNGVLLGSVAAPPYAVAWQVGYGSSDLLAVAYSVNGQPGTSAVVNVYIQPPPTDLAPPIVAGQVPAAGSGLTTLTSIQVLFSEAVTNLKAGDLLVNGVPAKSVTGSDSNYTFTVTQPGYGPVLVTWATNHTITDLAYPTWLSFDGTAQGATWSYTMLDRVAPTIVTRLPTAGSTFTNLTQITVTFSEAVSGVNASDLLVNGVPATGLSGGGASYAFTFESPPYGPAAITWASDHGIADLADVPNSFDGAGAGATWSYTIGDPIQTGNDNFGNRIALGTPAHVRSSNVGAGTENREPTGNFWSRYGATVWWTWTAPASGSVTLDTFGSAFNTTLGVFTGSSVRNLSQVAFNDNAPASSDVSLVTFNAVQGTTYQIQVGGMSSATGTIQLNLTMPPAVALTAPTNGSVFIAGSNFWVTATATAQGAAIKQVDFCRAGSLLGTVTAAPYALLLTDLPIGSNTLYAVATDTTSQVATSATVTVLVANLGVTLTAPADGTTVLNTNPITARAVTALPAGTITNVIFLVDDQAFGQDASAPFSAIWSNVSGGCHQITAVGQSDTGEFYVSQPAYIAVAQLLVRSNSVWKYLDNGSDQGTAWVAPGFDDQAWASGPAQLGYGDGDEATVVASGPTNNYHATTYFRRAFAVSNAASFASLRINVQRDDGAVVYLNGVETGRYNIGAGVITYTNWAINADDDGVGFFAGTAPASLLTDGTNVLAVEIHQSGATSSDISFDLEMWGIPRIVRNSAPTVALTSPSANTDLLVPTDLTLTATASDTDGSVAKVEFYLGNTKVAEATNSPYTVTLTDVPTGVYTVTAQATDDQGATRTTPPVTVRVYEVASRWVAFNDHYAGPGTHPNATAWNVFGTQGGAPGDEGWLRNVGSGSPLPAYLSVLSVGAVGETACGAPQPETPAAATFQGYVDFGSGGVNHAILVNPASFVMHLFTGLDPLRRYSLRATVTGGLEGVSNRWTLFTLAGAEAWREAHTASVLTTASQPGLAADEAAMNTGDNRGGEVIGWDRIQPGPDGSFVLISQQYAGPAPGNEQPGPAAFAPVAIRLEEFGARPLPSILSPRDGSIIQGPTNVTVTASATAFGEITNLLVLADGLAVGGGGTNPCTVTWADVPFGTHHLVAVAWDAQGLAGTSTVSRVTVITPPTNTIPPYVASQVPVAGAVLTNLTSIQVTFTEAVVGVDASDLLVNDVPATLVAGSGNRYTFTVAQPAFGSVRVRWTPDHGITDIGWPKALVFYENEPGASWTYELRDRVPPVITAKTPAAGASLTNLTQLSVTFSKAVAGVDASDLLVNGQPAYDLSGSESNYTFQFSQPASGTVLISWATNHGITDLAASPNSFNATGAGATWSYTLDARTILIASNSYWLFVKGTNEASSPATAWREAGFDDSSWSNAAAPFFFGDPYSNGVPAYTLLSDMRSNYTTIYLRKSFVLPNVAAVTNLYLSAQSDDGFIAWINGVEVYRYNMELGETPYNGVAATTANEPQNNGAAYITYTLGDPRAYLLPGTNVLAVLAANESLTASSDFGFNAQLYTYQANTEAMAPHVAGKLPAPGYLLELTNVTVTFSEPVTQVEAADLLLNGVPATGVTASSNLVYDFTFPQPPYGLVVVAWAKDHGIVDLDLTPKPFDEQSPSSTWQYTLLNPYSPYLVSTVPAHGASLGQLTQISVTFSELVTGVDAADLLINGLPAQSVSGGGSNYTFGFAQPGVGSVTVSWAAAHGIQDLSDPPQPFDLAWPTHTWTYTLADQTPPTVLSQEPVAGSVLEALTQVTVTFTEAVTGVNAGDLLVNGTPASSLSGSGAAYTFGFVQPNASTVRLSWATNHGIRDLAASPNAFDAGGPGATWSYGLLDRVPPSAKLVYPPPFASVRYLTNVTVTFDEPVQGLDVEDLLINNMGAVRLTGSGAGPYTFEFSPFPAGQVQVTWANGHDIGDFASPPNYFAGGNWTYEIDPNLITDVAVRHLIHISLDGAGAVYLKDYMNNAPSYFPNFVRLRNEGAWTLNARCDYDISVTLPNHSDMFTGRPVLQPAGWPITSYHGLTIDSDNGQTIHDPSTGNPNVPYKMSVFDVVHDRGLSTSFLYSKQSLTIFARSWDVEHGTNDAIGVNNGPNKIDLVFNSTTSGSYGPTAPVVDQVLARVQTNGLWNYSFLHFDDGDATGHASNWGSAAYSNALIVVDQQIGRILTALQASPTYANRVIVLVTADHGGYGSGHSDAGLAQDYTVPIFVWGPGMPAGVDLYSLMANRADPGTTRPSYTDTTGPQPLRNGDTGNLAMTLMGLPSIPGSSMIPIFGSVAQSSFFLTIARTGQNLTVSWLANSPGYELQSSSGLGRSVNWQTVSSGLLRTNGILKEYSVSSASGAPTTFFRLRKP